MISAYKAIDVMNAVHAVYLECGNGYEPYAKDKTNTFLRRCGADINESKEQLISVDCVKEIAYAMLDVGNELKLFSLLNRLQ